MDFFSVYTNFANNMNNETMQEEKRPKVFVSGCYDLLHSGHVEFFRQAAAYGDLYVGIGSEHLYTERYWRDPQTGYIKRMM